MMVLTFVLSQCFIVKLLKKPILLRIKNQCLVDYNQALKSNWFKIFQLKITLPPDYRLVKQWFVIFNYFNFNYFISKRIGTHC